MSAASPVTRGQLTRVLDAPGDKVATKGDLVKFADLIERQLPTLGKSSGRRIRIEILREDFHVPGVGTLPLATELVMQEIDP